MSSSEKAAGERLSTTTLRDFGQPVPHEDRKYDLPSYRVTLPPREAPVPVLLRQALTLTGLRYNGPGEKVAWWVPFTYKGYPCELAHQKFGLRLRIGGDLTEERAAELLMEIRKKLASAVKTVEALLTETAAETFNAGNVTVVNQHRQLRRAYDYFRERATNPDVIEDVCETGTSEDGGTWSTFLLGKNVMALNASHDLVAAISAFLSSLEHDLVLSLPFQDFNPVTDDLTRIIGDRWGEKWRRVVGVSNPEAVRLRERLIEVVERWRNPYSHGGFEKGHSATVYLHTPGIGALPVGLSRIRDSPLFSLHAVSESYVVGVFDLFDEIDAFLATKFRHAMEWIDADLDVRFDSDFMEEVAACIESDGGLEKLVETHGRRQMMLDNMDF